MTNTVQVLSQFSNSNICFICKGFWWLEEDLSANTKTKPEENLKTGSDMTNTKTSSEVFFRKASELKPLKRLNHTLDTGASHKLKDDSRANHRRGTHPHGEGNSWNKNSTTKPNSHPRRRSSEGSSISHHGNTSPGDSAGVKDVANVVVKYLSPQLKQGSIVSKVNMAMA